MVTAERGAGLVTVAGAIGTVGFAVEREGGAFIIAPRGAAATIGRGHQIDHRCDDGAWHAVIAGIDIE